MHYMLLLYASEAERERASAAQMDALARDHRRLLADLSQTGRSPAYRGLEHTDAATTLRVRGGRTLLCDGPFAETREQLLGVLLVEARDLDEAIAIAGRTPESSLGSVEIRPIREAT
jgi:hypothetical protein